MNEFVETILNLTWPQELKRAYDVVIIGAGGHGLSTAYHLATQHGITNVAVLERGWIGMGNSGRNTAIIRSNYGVPESVAFYDRSLQLYQQLEAQTGGWIMHSTKGIMWLAHTENGMRTERARSLLNQAMGVETLLLDPGEAKRICPQLDLSGGGRYPVMGGSYNVPGASSRHDRVVWTYAAGAAERGVHLHQHTEVEGFRMLGNKVVGVQTNRGEIAAGQVLIAVGGHVSQVAAHAKVRLPIRTHPLQAFVTNAFAQGPEHGLNTIVSSSELLFYVSQTARGQLLMGAEYEPQTSYSQHNTFKSFQSVAAKTAMLLPFAKHLRVLRQWAGRCDISVDFSPIMGPTGVDNLAITTGWGTWGFKAIPAGGEQLASYLATGTTPELIKPFALDRFERDHLLADQGSTGTK
jgi:sarcosine oxidase, subunit beta